MRFKNIFPLSSTKAPAVPKGTDWRDYSGEVRTPLIGVAVPEGIVVIDLDTYKGVTREDIEDALNCVLPWNDAFAQGTLNGGEHYAFEVPVGSNIINGANVLGVSGFDTRSAGKGYIATGEGYTDHTLYGIIEALHTDGYFPILPGKALDFLKIEHTPKTGVYGTDDFMSMVCAQPLELQDGEVDMYLKKLNKNHAAGDNWLKVMMAIYHQFNGSELGYEKADTFSKLNMDSYDVNENRKRWESFGKNKHPNPVTFASVIEMAGGKVVVVEEKTKDLRERIIKCENKTQLQELIREVGSIKFDDISAHLVKKDLSTAFKKITDTTVTLAQVDKMIKKNKPFERRKGDFINDYVFLTLTGEYMARDNKTVMGPRAFDVAMGRETPLDDDGNEIPATVFVRDKIEVAHTGMYAPQASKTGNDLFLHQNVRYFNTYMPTNLERVAQGTTDIVTRVKNHISHILADEREQDIFTNYLAHNVQNPGEKKHWAILIQGVEGDGKSFFAEMMKWVMGHQNSKSVGAESLEEKFTPWAEGSSLVFIEEIKLDNIQKHDVLNKMKPYITNPMVSVRRMRTDVYEAINTTNYVIFTNYQDALPLNDNDRRYAIMFSRWQDRGMLEKWMVENENYYSNLYNDMRENAGEILDWLMDYKISDSFKNMTRAPATDAKRRMVDMSRSDVALLIEDLIVTYECWDINDEIVNITKLTRMATDCFAEDRYAVKEFPKTSRLRNVMLELGYHSIGIYKDKNRQNQRYYSKDPTVNLKSLIDEGGDFIPF